MQSTLERIAQQQEREDSRFYGKYRGEVTAVGTDEHAGCVRAKVPAVLGDEEVTGWAYPASPYAGDGYGLYLMPEKGDPVWIEFENGSIEQPIWTGAWWRSGALPDPKDPSQRVLTSKKGMQIVMDDSDGKLILKHPGGASIELSDSGIVLKFQAKKIEITSSSVNVNGGSLEVS